MTKAELHKQYAEEILIEEYRVERLMTVKEVFSAGFKRGQSTAGLTSDATLAYRDWLLERSEKE